MVPLIKPTFWPKDLEDLLWLMPALRRPSFTRGEVLALGDGWFRAFRDPDYLTARNAAWARYPDKLTIQTISHDAWIAAFNLGIASGEWREDLLGSACNAVRDAAIGRLTAHSIKPAFSAILERVWHEVIEDDGKRPAEPVFGPEVPPPQPELITWFIERCLNRGWDGGYAYDVRASPAYDGALGPRRLAYDAALRRCREATWASGRDTLAFDTARAATAISAPSGGQWSDAETLSYAFCNDLRHTAEAVVARDLLAPDDFAILTETWRRHFGDLNEAYLPLARLINQPRTEGLGSGIGHPLTVAHKGVAMARVTAVRRVSPARSRRGRPSKP